MPMPSKPDESWVYSKFESAHALFHGEEATDPIAVFENEEDLKIFRRAKAIVLAAEEEDWRQTFDETFDTRAVGAPNKDDIERQLGNLHDLPASNVTIPWWNNGIDDLPGDFPPSVADYELEDLVRHAVGPFVRPELRDVFREVVSEVEHGEDKWGRHGTPSQAGWIIVAGQIHAKAELLWASKHGDHVPEAAFELLQLAAVTVRCLAEHGFPTRAEVEKMRQSGFDSERTLEGG